VIWEELDHGVEVSMWQQPKEYRQQIFKEDGKRIVVIPADFLLEGDEVVIRQEKDGVITIHPGDEIGREAHDGSFGLLGE
jgi:hypothetical protein